MIKFIKDREIYQAIFHELIPGVTRSLWIGTADIKDIYTEYKGSFIPFLEVLSILIERNIEVRLLYAKEPGPNFQKEFDRFPNLFDGLEQIQCPRVHLKCIIVDNKQVYMGSANLTGAGMGAKSQQKRNFESGILSDDNSIVSPLLDQFDSIWSGMHCKSCARKEFCTDYINIIGL